AASSQDLVRVSLMADVPNETILWRVESIVQRDCELDRAERGAGVAADTRHRLENVVANLIGNCAKLLGWKSPQIGRRVNTLNHAHCGRIVPQSSVLSVPHRTSRDKVLCRNACRQAKSYFLVSAPRFRDGRQSAPADRSRPCRSRRIAASRLGEIDHGR